ncbi:MAG TPA: glycosyltransferase family 2 protein [Gemmatimonadaceae bacterium]|nr:glycosyltransferase family 2 protein [Gemmatimonadaceae bacterium]
MPTQSEFLPGPGVAGLVSVIVPCYNRADIVGETIESVLSQTYENFEIVMVDDGSTDNTAGVISNYADPRIRYIYQTNGGLSAARNSALRVAAGEFIAFLDSDDLWLNWKLSAQVELFLRHSEVGLMWSDMNTFASAGKIDGERQLRGMYSAYGAVDFTAMRSYEARLSDFVPDRFSGGSDFQYYVDDFFRYMFSGNLVLPSTAIVRRERLRSAGPFDREFTGFGAEDYHFYFRILSQGAGAFMDVPTTLYRVHSAQMSIRNRLLEARANLHVLSQWLHQRPKSISKKTVRKSLASSHAWLGTEELNAGNVRTATRHFWESLRHHRMQPYTLMLLLLSVIPRRAASVLRALKRVALNPLGRPLAALVLLLSDDLNPIMRIAELLPLDSMPSF